jgi:polyhydroxyalkanoate synthesis regulator phasin
MIGAYLTWSAIKPLLTKAAPYLLILAAVGAVWFHGRHAGVVSESGNTAKAVAERDQALAVADHNYQQYVQADEARERVAEAVRQLEQDSADAEARVTAAHRAEMARVERERSRAVAEAQRRADALAERVRELSVAETCHEAMLEIVR